MSDNRRQVLDMLASGQITVEEADRLIAAIGDGPAPAVATGLVERPATAPRYLRVIVNAVDDKEGPIKVNVRVPLQLLRAGVRLASLIPPQAQDEVNTALRRQGVGFDISQIKPENVDELIDHLGELTVDVDGERNNMKVRVFCE
ncbi:MAG: hypothetical protein J2P45_00935 [Candidatus Dormibacteraeota bacterium]|nr:hypothetical protein [Candidatus Dormibacteraeota bacterium]